LCLAISFARFVRPFAFLFPRHAKNEALQKSKNPDWLFAEAGVRAILFGF